MSKKSSRMLPKGLRITRLISVLRGGMLLETVNDKEVKNVIQVVDDCCFGTGHETIAKRIGKLFRVSGFGFLEANYGMTVRLAKPEAHFIVYNYRNIVTLHEYVSVPLKGTQIAILVIGIASAITKLHEHGLTHGNLNPSTVLVDRETGYPILVDFGMTYDAHHFERLSESDKHFIAPELLQHAKKPGRRTDAYSFSMLVRYIVESSDPTIWREGRDEALDSQVGSLIERSVVLHDIIQRCGTEGHTSRLLIEHARILLVEYHAFLAPDEDLETVNNFVRAVFGGVITDRLEGLRNLPLVQKGEVPSQRNIGAGDWLLRAINDTNGELKTDDVRAAQLQRLLLEMVVPGSDEVVIKLLQTYRFLDRQDEAQHVILSIVLLLPANPMNTRMYANLTQRILELYPDLRSFLLSTVFYFDRVKGWIKHLAKMHYVYWCHSLNIITTEDILNHLDSLPPNEMFLYVAIWFCYFGPLIEERRPDMYQRIVDYWMVHKDDCDAPPDLTSFFQDLDEWKADGWKKQKIYIEDRSTVVSKKSCLMFDKALELREMLKDELYNPNETIEPDIFDPSPVAHDSLTLLSGSACYGAYKCFQYLHLLDPECQAVRDGKGYNLLHYAIAGGHADLIRFVSHYPYMNAGILHCATLYFHDSVFCAFMSVAGKKANTKEWQDKSILIMAAEANNVSVALYCLIHRRISPSSSYFGRTPIHQAVVYDSLDVLNVLLLDDHTDPNARDVWGMAPIHLAVLATMDTLKLLTRYDKVELNTVDKKGRTALHIAVNGNRLESVAFLLGFDQIKRNQKDKKGRTARDYAIQLGNAAMIDLFA